MEVVVAVLGGLPVPNSPHGLCELKDSSELRSCVKVEVVVLDSPFLIVLMVSVDFPESNTELELTLQSETVQTACPDVSNSIQKGNQIVRTVSA